MTVLSKARPGRVQLHRAHDASPASSTADMAFGLFVFCAGPSVTLDTTASSSSAPEEEDEATLPDLVSLPMNLSAAETAATMGLSLFTMQQLAAMSAGGATAATMGLGMSAAGIPLLISCVPIVAPFSTPPVAYNLWRPNKRAVAFQRSLMFLSVAQGVLAMWKFFGGNLIGGFFDAMIAGTGMYAASPEGVTMLPTYLTFAGFNGGMDLLQLIQMYHGHLPLYLLPFQYPAFRPILLLVGCYFTYEFHRELSAVYRGFESAGSKESLFVSVMGHEAWGPPPGCADHEAALIEARMGGAGGAAGLNTDVSGRALGGAGGAAAAPTAAPQQPRFAPFGGEGRTLG